MNTTSSFSPIRLANRWAAAGAVLACAVLSHGCASSSAPDARYPRRAPGCDLAVYHTAVPGVVAWDDIGVAEASCNIGGAVADCMRTLKAEACRMGGDLLYNVPKTPRRPRYNVMQLIGQVAHTRARGAKDGEDEKPPEKHDDAPPPANPEEAAGPVVPLPSGERPGDPAVDGAPATPAAPPAPAPAPAPKKVPAP